MSQRLIQILAPVAPEVGPDGEPIPPPQDASDRRTRRQRAFDTGNEPLPGYSWPPPRRTGWEREHQLLEPDEGVNLL